MSDKFPPREGHALYITNAELSQPMKEVINGNETEIILPICNRWTVKLRETSSEDDGLRTQPLVTKLPDFSNHSLVVVSMSDLLALSLRKVWPSK